MQTRVAIYKRVWSPQTGHWYAKLIAGPFDSVPEAEQDPRRNSLPDRAILPYPAQAIDLRLSLEAKAG